MLNDERLTPGPTDTEQTTSHDHAALLAVAARELRVIATTADARPVPAEFAAMATARLLEEISRAARGGHELPQHVLNAALEIAQHTISQFCDSGPTIGDGVLVPRSPLAAGSRSI